MEFISFIRLSKGICSLTDHRLNPLITWEGWEGEGHRQRGGGEGHAICRQVNHKTKTNIWGCFSPAAVVVSNTDISLFVKVQFQLFCLPFEMSLWTALHQCEAAAVCPHWVSHSWLRQQHWCCIAARVVLVALAASWLKRDYAPKTASYTVAAYISGGSTYRFVYYRTSRQDMRQIQLLPRIKV